MISLILERRISHIFWKIMQAALFAMMSCMFLWRFGYGEVYFLLLEGVQFPFMLWGDMFFLRQREYFRHLKIGILLTVALGGMEYAFTSVMQLINQQEYTVWKVGGVSAICIPLLLYGAVQRLQTDKFIYEVMICNKKQVCHCKGMWDSGNSLREPQSGLPVHIVAHQILQELKITEKEKKGEIAYQALGISKGTLAVYQVDMLTIVETKHSKQVTKRRKVYIGDAGEQMLQGKKFQIILNREM